MVWSSEAPAYNQIKINTSSNHLSFTNSINFLAILILPLSEYKCTIILYLYEMPILLYYPNSLFPSSNHKQRDSYSSISIAPTKQKRLNTAILMLLLTHCTNQTIRQKSERRNHPTSLLLKPEHQPDPSPCPLYHLPTRPLLLHTFHIIYSSTTYENATTNKTFTITITRHQHTSPIISSQHLPHLILHGLLQYPHLVASPNIYLPITFTSFLDSSLPYTISLLRPY